MGKQPIKINLHVMQNEDLSIEEAFDWDDSKLVIFAERAGMTGDELHQISFEKIPFTDGDGFRLLCAGNDKSDG